MRALLIKGIAGYNVTRRFIDEIAGGFAARGDEAVIEDAAAYPNFETLLAHAAAQGPYDLVYTICIKGEHRDARGRSLGEIIGAPHVLHHVDYPLSHHTRLVGSPRSMAILVIDPTHIAAIKSTFGEDHFAHVAFCPHGAIGAPAPAQTLEAFAARPIPLLFAGTFYKPEEPFWAKLDRDSKALMDDAFARAIEPESMPALDALDAAMTAQKLDPTDPRFMGFRRNCYAIHERVRVTRRFAFLTAAAKAGLPVHCYGSNYDKQKYRFKSFSFGGDADVAQTETLMRQSQLVLNVNANFGAGSHERPLSAMINGAAAVSDHSTFYETAFSADEILLYRWRALDEGIAAIAALAQDTPRAYAMAQVAQEKAAAQHRWVNRVDTIIAAADAARAASPRLAAA